MSSYCRELEVIVVAEPRIHIPKARIAGFCQRNHIHRLSLFGSVLREDFRADSDVDVLVEFEPGHTAGLIRMVGLERELSNMLGRRVDLRTPAELSEYFRDEVVGSSEVQYAQG
ncbi:MAG: nucleotidyltransferase family protein [Candidatus Eisenbacteria sp.]|nr:nucleotidyltransferase family protein [Candidatus Eisenbacteria bacterium]